ncbi:hypothetical protein MTR67_041716 [Solanum verrucosum]|uniref:Uncharacterized protein n=1 Tax=Solanum verrucosum TaxID=315347 RepID=A0AAF0ZR15_SOLVR|nr:hypothetical protein MTR67_041716 [Solanum verrucosum]
MVSLIQVTTTINMTAFQVVAYMTCLAEDILNDLVSRNLIQVAKRTYDGRISSCRIHDLLHSLCVELAKESNFFHTEHNAFGDPDNIARIRRITFYSDNIAMNEFFLLNPKPTKLRSLFCFTKDRFIFSQLVHLDFKLLQVLVVVTAQNVYERLTIPNKIGNMSCLRYVRLEGGIRGKLPNSIVKLKCLETLDIIHSYIKLPFGVWESKKLRHLCYREECYCVFFGSPFCRIMPPNNLQTLMWLDDKFCEPRMLHRLINLRKLGIWRVSDSTIKILSALSPVPKALEVLELRFFNNTSEQINLSSHPNIVKLVMFGFSAMLLNIEAFHPNLVKLTLVGLMVDGNLLAVLKKLPKLRILTLHRCRHDAEKMDLSGNGDSFPQLEVLHIKDARGLSEVTCMDDMSMPKLKKLLLVQGPIIYSPIRHRVSERLAMLRI